jgi:hypothetical protein
METKKTKKTNTDDSNIFNYKDSDTNLGNVPHCIMNLNTFNSVSKCGNEKNEKKHSYVNIVTLRRVRKQITIDI